MSSVCPGVFETYQTFITGMLGFTGVIITLIVNANIQKSAQKRQKEHELRALRVALKTELNVNKESFETRIQQFEEPTEYNTALVPNQIYDQVYTTLVDKIGQLSEEEIENVTKAYLLMAELPTRIRILVGTDSVVGYEGESIKVSGENLSIVCNIHKSMLPEVVKAVESIQLNLS